MQQKDNYQNAYTQHVCVLHILYINGNKIYVIALMANYVLILYLKLTLVVKNI